MKKAVKAILTFIVLTTALIFNAYNHFDKPVKSCDEYVKDEQLNDSVCR